MHPALATAVVALLLTGAREDALPERFGDWLRNDVVAIVTTSERDAFLDLATDAERERFIELFWQARDPTPGTRRNERREEHERRLAYANDHFGRDGTRPGSRSDRGRMYTLLGEPNDRRLFHSGARNLYPAELWFYQAPKNAGLPAFFHLLFFKRNGFGDYRVYSPIGDGPEALVGGVLSATSRSHALGVLGDIDLELRTAAITLDLGGGADTSDESSPSLVSDLLLARVFNLPERQTDTRYLDEIAAGKVRTEVSFNQYALDAVLYPSVAPDGITWLDYELVVAPQHLTLIEYEGRFSSTLELLAVFTSPEHTVRVSEHIDLDLSGPQFERARSAPLAVEGRVALVPAAYQASFLLRDQVTGKFGVVERKLTIRPPDSAEPAAITSWFLAFRSEPAQSRGRADRLPFAATGLKLYPAHEARFSLEEKPWFVAQLRYPLDHASGGSRLVKTISLLRDGNEVFGYMGFLKPNPTYDAGILTLVEELRLSDPAAGLYELVVRIGTRGGETLAEQKHSVVFENVPPPRPWTFAREAPDTGAHLAIARQRLERNEPGLARETLVAGIGGPLTPGERLETARLLLDLADAEHAHVAVAPLLGGAGSPALAHVYAAASLLLLERADEAVGHYEIALRAAGGDVALLNALCGAYRQAGRIEEARRCFERSLELRAEQPAVVRALADLR